MKSKSILRLSTIAIALSSVQAATYNWVGTTSDFDLPANWVENAWTQWGDYRFGTAAASGAVNLDAFFGGGNWHLDSGLAHDVTVTGSQPLVSQSGAGNGGNITIAADSKNLDLQLEFISFGPVTWNVGDGRTLTMTGQLNNWYAPASLVKQGSGTAVLKAANGYSSGTTLSGGSLRLENTAALGTGGLSMSNGTTLQLRSDTDATFAGGNGLGGIGNAAITFDVNQLTTGNTNKTLTFATAGFDTYNSTINVTGGNGYTLALGGINNGYGGSLTLNAETANLSIGAIGSASPPSSLTVGGAATTTITGAVNSAGGLTKNDSGTLNLTAVNSYTGETTVTGGTLSLGNGTSNTNLSDGATVNIAFGATVNLNFSGSDTVGKLIIDGNTMSGGTYNAATHPDYFTGSGSLTVLNQDGTWTSTASGNWGTSSNWQSNVIASGTDKTATFSAGTGSDSITVTLDTARQIGNLAFSNANYTLAGSNTLTFDSTTNPAINVGVGSTATVSANLAGSLGFEKSGSGALTLTAGNTFTGETLVTGGLLQLGASSGSNPQFGALENSYLLTINSGATVRAMGANAFKGWSGGSMDVTLNGGTLTINDGVTEGGNHNLGYVILNGGTISGVGNSIYGGFNLSGMLTVTDDSTISASHLNTGNGNRIVDVADGKTLTWSGVISNGSAVGITSLTFLGTGTTVLSGANTYTGNTVVNDGSLQLTSTSQMQFVVTDAPASNQITGTGAVSFDGVFNINTSAVAGTTGYIWLLVDRANLTGESFGSNFSVAGFAPQVDGVTWTMSDSRGTWSFSEDTGELTLDIGSDFDTWVSANGVTGGPDDDDDADGLTNHEEYAFGLDPTGGSSVNPIAVQLNKTTGIFSYTRRLQSLTGLTYSVWYSTDLATWTEDAGAAEGTVTVTGDVETVPVTISPALLTNPKLFVQVRAN